MGGGKSSSPPPVVQAPTVTPAQLQTTGYGGMGYYSVPNPFVQGARPTWMQGNFAAPWWGMDAVSGQPLTPAQLQQPAPAPAPAPVPAGGGQGNVDQMQDMLRRIRAQDAQLWAMQDPEYRNMMQRSPGYENQTLLRLLLQGAPGSDNQTLQRLVSPQ